MAVELQTEPSLAGKWQSPITSKLACGAVKMIPDVLVDGNLIYHLESDPTSGALNLKESATGTQVTPKGSNSRTRVHEYGGGSSIVSQNKAIMSDFATNSVYQRTRSSTGDWSESQKVVPENPSLRYADFDTHPQGNLIVCVREDHTGGAHWSNVVNTLSVIDSESKESSVISSGASFYASPRFSPDGNRLVYFQWNLPHMPWETSLLFVADFDAETKSVSNATMIGGSDDYSVREPRWVDNDRILFMSDKTGFDRPYLYSISRQESQKVWDEVNHKDIGKPAWSLGGSCYCVLSKNEALFHINASTLTLIDLDAPFPSKVINIPYRNVSALRAVSSDRIAFFGTSPTAFGEVVDAQISRSGDSVQIACKGLVKESDEKLDVGYLSSPRVITFPSKATADASDSRDAYAIFYAPTNKSNSLAAGELSPCIVNTHGGPSSSASTSLNLQVQYFTSRGFSFVDVDYSGSTGYGKEYRDRLKGNWGVVDCLDSVACVQHLANLGLVDSKRTGIQGGSAGGFTTLKVLCDTDVFKAGCSLYGISDLLALTDETHKFESGYDSYCFGGDSEEEFRQILRDRSPINHADNIKADMLILQGSEDKVVLPNQAELIVSKLRAQGKPVEYILFEGEGHGFRQAANKIRTIESQLTFYLRAFGIH